MISVLLMYPTGDDTTFDMDYYTTKHMPMFAEALGEGEGFFDSAEFEENMSTHYGRMIHEDDRTIMFANPEDAAEYIGFDLKTYNR